MSNSIDEKALEIFMNTTNTTEEELEIEQKKSKTIEEKKVNTEKKK